MSPIGGKRMKRKILVLLLLTLYINGCSKEERPTYSLYTISDSTGIISVYENGINVT